MNEKYIGQPAGLSEGMIRAGGGQYAFANQGQQDVQDAPNACEKKERDSRVGPHALGLAAQAWREPGTSHKQMDTDLCIAFAQILERELRKPWLGNATTHELIEELRARCDLDYHTVGRHG